MKKSLPLILMVATGLQLSATQYCQSVITGINQGHQAQISCESLGDNQYLFTFVSADTFTGYNQGSNFYANVNGAGGFQVSQHLTQSGDTLRCIISSNQVPNFYVADFFVNYSTGEEWYKIPLDADFSQSCEGIVPQEPDTTGNDNPTQPSLSYGFCSGSGTGVDHYYTSANPQYAINSLALGYKYSMETNNQSVNITFQFLDNLEGMAAPYLFRFDENDVLIGDPIPMNWNENTRTATYSLHGLSDGDELSFLVHVALAEGKILFSDRVIYVVGTSCEDIPDISSIENAAESDNLAKRIIDGQLIILRDSCIYDVMGRKLKK